MNEAIETGALFEGEVWKAIVERSRARRSTLHLIGLLSDGNVHSHIDQLLALIDGAARDGVARVRVHIAHSTGATCGETDRARPTSTGWRRRLAHASRQTGATTASPPAAAA